MKLKVKLILPALTEATSPYWRPIKYSLFPPLGLATLAGYFNPDDEIDIRDEHVEKLDLDDNPDLVVLQVYITSAYRAYEIARHYRQKGAYVVMGGLHVTSLPDEALRHADTIFTGPSDDSWREFINDFRNKRPKKTYYSEKRSFDFIPEIRRDLIKRHLYLVPNSIIVSRGCPYNCSFCYKHSFLNNGKSFYIKKVDRALREIEQLPGKHLFFLDDNILGDLRFAEMLFDGMKGMNKVWQAAANVTGILNHQVLDKAADSGLKSLFIGFESLNYKNLQMYQKNHNNIFRYNQAIKLLHDRGIMINASFVFGMDEDDESVFDTTVNWAISQGIETSTFHILTPYPGTKLYSQLDSENRITTKDWNLYDTRHSVFTPRKMTSEQLEKGYWKAYKDFYSWSSILKSSGNHELIPDRMKHFIYSSGWKKFENLWHIIIKLKKLNQMVPILEKILSGSQQSNKMPQNNIDTKIDIHKTLSKKIIY